MFYNKVLLILLLGMVHLSNVFAVNGNMGNHDGYVPDGSENYPWLIEDFADFQVFCSDTFYWQAGVHTRLDCHLDLNPNDPSLFGREIYIDAVISPEFNNGYYGVFNGNSKTISNLKIDTVGSGVGYLGLFGYVHNGAIILNLKVFSIEILSQNKSNGVGLLCGGNAGYIVSCISSGVADGANHVGGLCGLNSGDIVDSSSSGSLSGKENVGGLCGFNSDDIVDSSSSGSISGQNNIGGLCGFSLGAISVSSFCGYVSGDSNVGGGVGENRGNVSKLYSNGSCNGNYSVGGLCGTNSGWIHMCYSTSMTGGNDSIGGFCGINKGSVKNCYSTGSVQGHKYYVGGFCGKDETGMMEFCYSTGLVRGAMDSIGGFCGSSNNWWRIQGCIWDINSSGQSESFGGEGYPTYYLKISGTYLYKRWDFVGEDTNGNEDIWILQEGKTYPQFNILAGQGKVLDPFYISTSDELSYVSNNNAYWDKHLKLKNDIDLGGMELSSIGRDASNAFTGTFDGDRHVISDFTVSNTYDVGLFGLVSGQGAQIKQLGIEAVTIGLSDDPAGSNVGGLVGRLSGGAKVSECFVTDDSGAVRIFGTDNVGGLVGFVSDSGTVVENCYTLFNHSGTSEEQTRISSNNVTGNNATGGLAGGLSGGALRNCYSDAYIATVLSGVSKGFIAGCVADDTGSQIELCYYDADREDEDSSINNNGESCDLGDIDGYYIYEDEEATVWDFVSNDDRYEELLLPLGLSDDGNYDLWYMYDNGSKKFPKFWWQHPERSDVNCDNKVDIDDLFIIAEEWLTKVPFEGGRLLSDINKEDGVNLTDFSQLACKWLIDLK